MPISPSSACALARAREAHGRQRDERAFTLVELIVALLIIAILLGLAITQLRGSKQTTYFKTASAVALTYSDAIEAYMADNGQRVPRPGVAGEWPNVKQGPVDALRLAPGGGKRPYLRSVPEPVSSGLVRVFGSSGTGSPRATVTLQTPGGAASGTYRLVVSTTTAPILRCVVSNRALRAGDKACA